MKYCTIINDNNTDSRITEEINITLQECNLNPTIVSIEDDCIKEQLKNTIITLYILSEKPTVAILTFIGYSLAFSKNVIVIAPHEIPALKRFDSKIHIVSIDQCGNMDIKHKLKNELNAISRNLAKNLNYCLESEKMKRVNDLWAIGNTFLERNEYDKADYCWRELLAIMPSHYKTIYKWGTTLLRKALDHNIEPNIKRQLLEAARDKYCKSLDYNNEQQDAYNNLAVVLKNLAQLAHNEKKHEEAIALLNEAIRSFKKAIAIRPDYCDAMYNLGLVYATMYQYTDDRQYMEQLFACMGEAYDICPYRTDEFPLFLAKIYALIDDKGECYECLKQCEILGILPKKEYILNNSEFESIKNELWIDNLEWAKGEHNE